MVAMRQEVETFGVHVNTILYTHLTNSPGSSV